MTVSFTANATQPASQNKVCEELLGLVELLETHKQQQQHNWARGVQGREISDQETKPQFNCRSCSMSLWVQTVTLDSNRKL